jgi:hypothetical protein
MAGSIGRANFSNVLQRSAAALLCLVLTAVLFLWWEDFAYARREARIRRVVSGVVPGVPREQVLRLMGDPSFIQTSVTNGPAPSGDNCCGVARSAYVYQDTLRLFRRDRPRETIIVYFDDAGRTTCVERSTRMSILVR